MFYRVGGHNAISLDETSIISCIQVGEAGVTLTLRDGSTIVVNEDHPDYAAWVQFVSDSSSLVYELEQQRLRAIQREHRHPLMDEMPSTLFTLFQSLPPTEGMELHLLQSGAGELWKDGQCVLSWGDFSEGLILLAKQHAGVLA